MIGPDCVIVTWHQVFIERTNFGPGVLTTSMGSVDRKMKGSPFDDGFLLQFIMKKINKCDLLQAGIGFWFRLANKFQR